MAKVKRYYIEGSAAREINEPLPTREERRIEEQRRKERVRRERERRRAEAARRNRLSAMKAAAVTLVISSVFGFYLYLQNDINKNMKEVASVENRITEKKSDIASRRNAMASGMNLNNVRDIAANQLGMVYAGSDQIVYYSVDDTDYMTQYEDIPK